MIIKTKTLNTTIGPITVYAENNYIIYIEFTTGDRERFYKHFVKFFDSIEFSNGDSAVISQLEHELHEYFAGKRTEFDVKYKLYGTDFRKKVWNELLKIPYGKTKSYGDIAKAVGNPKASRAVGGANHNNPISIIVPCHRVIGSDKNLTGYGGGLDIKKKLLELEGAL